MDPGQFTLRSVSKGRSAPKGLQQQLQSSSQGPAPLYDQFSIGWNEIFDAGPAQPTSSVGPTGSRQTPVSPHQGSRGPFDSKSDRTPSGHVKFAQGSSEDHGKSPSSQLPQQSTHGHGSEHGGGIWASEVLTSKKPPAYLRIPGSKSSAVDASLKEHLLRCPPSRLRKPSEIMEVELNQLRWTLTEQHREKRKQAKKMRRLHRKCRVRPNEDIEELEEKYGAEQGHLEPLQDPVDLVEARSGGKTAASARDFFVGLGRRHVGLARAQGWEDAMPMSAR